ncbi:hypothetical protein RUM44_006447 [Polyplax serrata]|uniref:Uncharacterized protein n=1 Tax=Polyplax serrata TaxID=468196 RepID=A0ABR1AIA8_POLSC
MTVVVTIGTATLRVIRGIWTMEDKHLGESHPPKEPDGLNWVRGLWRVRLALSLSRSNHLSYFERTMSLLIEAHQRPKENLRTTKSTAILFDQTFQMYETTACNFLYTNLSGTRLMTVCYFHIIYY